ncbi:general stress protein [Psychrobacillus sp. NPDC058041]|uniref:general stress protein n=1 Tax=Psychrobacillus sp. NPDC058041 TaxID=3346310 RepID=UPI0036D7CA48
MNIESNRRIEIARTEEEMYEKLELLQKQGYAESDIHVISKEHAHLHTLNRHSDVSTHEAGSFMDTFKSWFTGEDAVTEGLRKLDLNAQETERYSKEVSNGSIVLYTEVLTHADNFGTDQNDIEYTDTVGTDVFQSRFSGEEELLSDYSKEQGFTKSTNEFVNETDGKFDEPQDRFVRGETFATDPYLAKEVNHIGSSMQEDKIVREHRPTIDESITEEDKKYGEQSRGIDPNLGRDAFESEVLKEEENPVQEQHEEKLERQRQLDDINPMNRLY